MAVKAGLTGGIASGKSVAADLFAECGAEIIDADIISRDVVKKGSLGEAEIAKAFPSVYYGGAVDRSALRKLVFENNTLLEKLNGITHPLIKKETESRLQRASGEVVILVAPLLFEAGFAALTNPNITVGCSVETRIARLIKRDNISKEFAVKMIASQLSDEERRARADIIIENNGSLPQLRAEVIRVYCKLKERAKEI